VAWPYAGGQAAAAVAPGARGDLLAWTLLTPVPVLGSTFAGGSVLRTGRLYGDFPLGQALPYADAAPSRALAAVAAAAALLALLALARSIIARSIVARTLVPRRPAGLAPLAALALLLAAPAPARAQLFPEPQQGDDSPKIGSLETRVNLGYWVPKLDGYIQVNGKGNPGQFGSKLSFNRVLGLEQLYVLPTFEVQLSWANAGAVSLQYFEAVWHGHEFSGVPRNFEEATISAGSFIDTTYHFRTIALAGALYIPLTDFLTGKIITTQRYVRYETNIRSTFPTPVLVSRRNSVETLIPTIGVGLDASIIQQIAVYGDIQWLDFTTDWAGASNTRWTYKYREWHLGVRLELVEHAHVSVEWFFLDTTVIDGGRERYTQTLQGPRVQVAILF
jgi:hypothetical protein